MHGEFSGDVMDVLGQLFEASATALDDGDLDTARRCLTSAETVATNKLPTGEFRSRLLHGCGRAVATLEESEEPRSSESEEPRSSESEEPRSSESRAAAIEHCRAMAREVDARR